MQIRQNHPINTPRGSKPQMPDREYILGGRVTPSTQQASMDWIFENAKAQRSKYVCFSTVHMIMEAYDSSDFRSILEEADFVITDGMPLKWVLNLLGHKKAERVTAPDVSLLLCERAANEGVPVGFYGASPETIENLVKNLKACYPKLNVVYHLSPPFRPLTPEEDAKIVAEINASGAQILFMGLGCPKQERWMNTHRGQVNAVMLGVGATFDWHAGKNKRAPQWVQNLGMEWFHRLLEEPKRLWKRYLNTNPRFVGLVTLQLLGLRKFSGLNKANS